LQVVFATENAEIPEKYKEFIFFIQKSFLGVLCELCGKGFSLSCVPCAFLSVSPFLRVAQSPCRGLYPVPRSPVLPVTVSPRLFFFASHLTLSLKKNPEQQGKQERQPQPQQKAQPQADLNA